jgi:hypothetical protein
VGSVANVFRRLMAYRPKTRSMPIELTVHEEGVSAMMQIMRVLLRGIPDHSSKIGSLRAVSQSVERPSGSGVPYPLPDKPAIGTLIRSPNGG